MVDRIEYLGNGTRIQAFTSGAAENRDGVKWTAKSQSGKDRRANRL